MCLSNVVAKKQHRRALAELVRLLMRNEDTTRDIDWSGGDGDTRPEGT